MHSIPSYNQECDQLFRELNLNNPLLCLTCKHIHFQICKLRQDTNKWTADSLALFSQFTMRIRKPRYVFPYITVFFSMIPYVKYVCVLDMYIFVEGYHEKKKKKTHTRKESTKMSISIIFLYLKLIICTCIFCNTCHLFSQGEEKI